MARKIEQKFFIARGGFNMPEEINRQLLLLVLDTVADVSEAVTKRLKTVSEFAAEDFFPSAPAGVAPVAMPAEVHFATFVAAIMASLEYGMEERRPYARTGCVPCGRSRKSCRGYIRAAPLQLTLGAFSKGP